MRIFLLLACLTMAGAACSPAPPEQQILADAAEALGGRDRVMAVTTVSLEGEGTHWNVGQDMTMDATGQTFAVTGYRRAIDLSEGRMQVRQTRTPNFLYYQGQAPQTQTFGLDGDVAYGIGANGTATRASAQAAQDRLAEMYHHPLVLVRAALSPGATVTNARTEGTERLVDITLPSAGPFTLAIDAGSGLPTRIRSTTAHPNLGDVTIETQLTDYVELDGLQLPQRLVTMLDRYKSAELRLSRPIVNGALEDMAAPESVRATAAPAAPAVSVVPTQVAPGVWLMGGQSHHSALIEFADHLVLIEAPQSEARSLAVIARARELVPGKPLTTLIASHHHFDHTAGLRAAIAEGLTVLTHPGNVSYFTEAATRPHTRQPDRLATTPRPATIEPVTDGHVLADASRRVELYYLPGNPHGDTLLMAYLPAERLVIEADAFSPGPGVHPYAPNLLEVIRRRKLAVERIVPLHGAVVPLSDLVSVVPVS
jgi:glyoxylase-like metal-dependent hydrolase (beta-lactamase superfamily II)